jgi:hypothetical protein
VLSPRRHHRALAVGVETGAPHPISTAFEHAMKRRRVRRSVSSSSVEKGTSQEMSACRNSGGRSCVPADCADGERSAEMAGPVGQARRVT